MKEEVIFRMESAYREDFEVKSYHFGGPEKTMCIIGNMRGNEIQQLYIAMPVARQIQLDLKRLRLRLLQAEEIGVQRPEGVLKALLQAGADAVDVPRDQFHRQFPSSFSLW